MLKNKYTGNDFAFSCEVFPPKRNDDMYEIFKTLDEIKELNPDFISVTYGAGGSNSKKTATVAAYIQNICEIDALAHMTAVGMDDEILEKLLFDLHKKGVGSVLALRGDKPKMMTDEEFENRYFRYASDIIEKIKKNGQFKIAAACYPEKHPESDSVEKDIEMLKYKADLGADMLISQMFFDNEKYFRFLEKIRNAGITVPVHAGIMPITKPHQLGTTVSLSGSSVPTELSNLIAKYTDNPEDMYKAGVDYAIRQVDGLLKYGVDGIHLYCMNKSDVTIEIYNSML